MRACGIIGPDLLKESTVAHLSASKSESTRQNILLAASRHFARTPYSMVNLDEILAEAEVTKGGLYFHFRSKYALAMAIMNRNRDMTTAAVTDLFDRRLSGVESFVEMLILIADQDIRNEVMRASLNLLESVGRANGLRASILAEWIKHLAMLVERGIAEGDVIEGSDPEDVSRMLVSLYMGVRQTTDPDNPYRYLDDLAKVLALALPGFTKPDRVSYFTEFIRRRIVIAVPNARG